MEKYNNLWKTITLIAVLGLSSILLFYRLDMWPITWYDEGVHLQVPKNIVLGLGYGIDAPDGFRTLDPLVNVGPTVLLPIALAFKLVGTGLYQARFVMTLYALSSIVCLYLLSKNIFDWKTAITAVLLMIAAPYFSGDTSANFSGLGRMALGEIPALFYFILGSIIWFIALERNNNIFLVLAGISFGFSMVTKQHSLLIIVTLLSILTLDRLWYRQLSLRQVLTPLMGSLVVVLIWYLIQSYSPGSSYSAQIAGTNRSGTLALVGLLSPTQIVRNVRVLLSSGVLIWGIPGLIYGIYLCQERSLAGLKRAFLLSFSLLWLAWFVIGSIGWLRYALPGIAVMNIFSARLFSDLSSGFSIKLPRLGDQARAESLIVARNLAVTLIVAFVILTPVQETIKNITSANDSSPFDFADFIDRELDAGSLIESFEPEIVFLSDRQFHQPNLRVLMTSIRHVQLGQPYSPGVDALGDVKPDYLVSGAFSKWTGLYDQFLKEGNYTLVTSMGGYDLYEIEGQSESP